jgi:para-nitrobenzyl esterase
MKTPSWSTQSRFFSPVRFATASVLFIAAATALIAALDSSSVATLVMTEQGPVQGIREGDVFIWRGIPYAAPPVGERRWRRPEPPAQHAKVLDATAFRSVCAQGGGNVGGEDCLYLNVYVPASARGRSLPVLFWIHGGGNTAGTGQSEAHALARSGSVVVTIDYRLGNLAWIGHPALADEALSLYGASTTGNYGYLDMIAALTWVKRNIASFGGSLGRVTIFGESAGGANVARLLTSPLSRGLVHGAVAQSGQGVLTLQNVSTLEQAEGTGRQLAAAIGCTRDDPAAELACLRAAPVGEILDHGVFFDATTVIDGYVFSEVPLDVYRQHGMDVPLTLTSNAQDAIVAFFYPFPMTEEEYVQAVHHNFAEIAGQLLTLYPVSAYSTPFDAWVDLLSDASFACPNRALAQIVTTGGGTVYWGLYTHRIENDPELAALGAYHNQEVNFVFGEFNDYLLGGYTPTVAELQFSSDLRGYWTRFAAHLDPNGAGAVPWAQFTSAGQEYLRLDDTFVPGTRYKAQACDLLFPCGDASRW